MEQDPATALKELHAELRASEALRQSVSAEELDNAIALATDCLRTGSDTGVGRRLQQFVWSLWNDNHWINLYDLSSYTDRKISEAIIILFRAAMAGALTENDIRKILTDSCEFARWEECRASTPDDEDVLYPPLPMSAKTLMSLAVSAQKSAKRFEEEADLR
jgi:plasmid stability protein